MATFNSKPSVDKLIAGNGWDDTPDDVTGKPYPHDAPDNAPAIRIVEYHTPEGATAWGIVFAGDRDPLRYERETQYVRRPRLIWEQVP